jgi:hypothetical protein
MFEKGKTKRFEKDFWIGFASHDYLRFTNAFGARAS